MISGRGIVVGWGRLAGCVQLTPVHPAVPRGCGGARSSRDVVNQLVSFTVSIASFHELSGKGVHRHLSSVVVLVVVKHVAERIDEIRAVTFNGRGLHGLRSLNVFGGNVPSRPALFLVRRKLSSVNVTRGVTTFVTAFRRRLTRNIASVVCVSNGTR